MKTKDTNITISVTNIEQSISFCKSLGFDLKVRWDNHYAQMAAPGIVIGLPLQNHQILQKILEMYQWALLLIIMKIRKPN